MNSNLVVLALPDGSRRPRTLKPCSVIFPRAGRSPDRPRGHGTGLVLHQTSAERSLLEGPKSWRELSHSRVRKRNQLTQQRRIRR